MSYSRREAIRLTTMTGATITGATLMGTAVGLRAARAQGAAEGHAHETDAGEIVIHPVEHASFVLTTPGLVIYNDPVGGAALYEGLPPPGLILITHEHQDHFDPGTLEAIVGDGTALITNPSVHEKLPAALQAKATAIANGETTTAGEIGLDAIPAYNLTEDRLKYHPKGRDNGYVLTIGGRRIYIAGDTEDIPEMRALEAIDIAFVPMNLPYTMDVTQAASAVAEFAPGIVYPYHYGESDIDEFARQLGESGAATEIARGGWYPAS
ncbi:MBL fold metallo-hydrolase [Amaricoccus sp. W119]